MGPGDVNRGRKLFYLADVALLGGRVVIRGNFSHAQVTPTVARGTSTGCHRWIGTSVQIASSACLLASFVLAALQHVLTSRSRPLSSRERELSCRYGLSSLY